MDKTRVSVMRKLPAIIRSAERTKIKSTRFAQAFEESSFSDTRFLKIGYFPVSCRSLFEFIYFSLAQECPCFVCSCFGSLVLNQGCETSF